MPLWRFRRRRRSVAPGTQQSNGNFNNATQPQRPAVCPPARGEREVLAWINNGSPQAVNAILRARDSAAHDTSLEAVTSQLAAPPGTPRASRWSIRRRSTDLLHMNVPEPLPGLSDNASRIQSFPATTRKGQIQRAQVHSEVSGSAASSSQVRNPNPYELTLTAPVTVFEAAPSQPRRVEGPTSAFSPDSSDSEDEDTKNVPGTVEDLPEEEEAPKHGQQDDSEDQEEGQDEQDQGGREPEDQIGEWGQAVIDAIGQNDNQPESNEPNANVPAPDPPPNPPPNNPPLYAPFTEQGEIRLAIIRQSFNMDPSTPTEQIRDFLARNIPIMRHLVYGTVAHPDWQFTSGPELFEMRVWDHGSHEANTRLWQAITEIEWREHHIDEFLRIAGGWGGGEARWYMKRGMRRSRLGVLPMELHRRILVDDEEYERVERMLFERTVLRRRNRPWSLLREAVPQDEPALQDEAVSQSEATPQGEAVTKGEPVPQEE